MPTNEELGSWLLVPLPGGCPADLAARITVHNQAAATWKARLDTLVADWAALGRAIREQIGSPETRMTAIVALKAEQAATFTRFRELLTARVALVKELGAVVAGIDREIIKSLGPEIRAAEDALRRSGWPWPYPAGHG